MVSFYFGMSLLEGKTVEEAKKEVEKKFLPTYQVGTIIDDFCDWSPKHI